MPEDVLTQKHAVRVIAAATGTTTLAVTLWFPFLPLFMLQVGAVGEADAIFWVAVAQTVQGVTRLIGGPFWGFVADRFGRKQMFVRTLFCAALTTFIVSAIGAPWQLSIALGVHGLLSGFVPAAIALTSVSVPDGKLKDALSLVTGGQYLGSAIGPIVGALLLLAFGYRGAIFGSGLLIVVVAFLVMRAVPEDVMRIASEGRGRPPLAPFRPTVQLLFATFLYFILFGLNTFRSVATPIVLSDIVGGDATGATGIAFAVGGVASAFGIWLLSGRLFQRQRLGHILVVSALLLAVTHFQLALSNSVWQFVFWFAVVSLLNAGMMPVTNTLIAFNVTRERRGTAFGLASAAQAVAFMMGPMAAAFFATTSLQAGFTVLGGFMVALAIAIQMVLREPAVEQG